MRRNKNKSNNTVAKVGKKHNETLASVLSESVLEALLDEFASNENFIGEFEGETAYIGLLFNVNDIGGLSKKTNRDEDKGALVEQIKSGRIKALITPALLADECMVIVPDAVTIDAMSEFSILENVSYRLCYVTKSGKIVATNTTVQLSDVQAIFQYDDKAEDVFFKNGSHYFKIPNQSDFTNDNSTGGNTEEFASDDVTSDVDDDYEELTDPDAESASAPVPIVEDFAPVENEQDYDEPDSIEDYDVTAEDDFVSDDFQNEVVSEGEDEPVDYIDSNDEDAEDMETVSDEAVADTIARKFYSSELGLEITSEPFDVQFMNDKPYVPFDENRGEGWLNEYLNNMSRNANAEMMQLHNANISKLRKRYLQLVAMHCEDIQRKLDISDENTRYGQINKGLKAQRVEAKRNIGSEVDKRKKSLEEAWDRKLEQVGEDASRMAKQQYRERFGEAHDAELFRLEPDVAQEIEDSYQDAVRQMNEERRIEASKTLDYGINSILKDTAEEYESMLQSEQTRYRELQNSMLDFIESNRKDEVARIETLKAEQERNSRAGQVMQEATDRINQMKAEFETSREALKMEIEDIQRNSDARFNRSKQDYEDRLQDARNQNDALQKRFDDLLARYANIDKEKEQEFSARIGEISDDRDAWKSRCEHIQSANKHSNIISIFLLIVSVVAAVAIGIICGYAMCSNNNSSQSNVQPPTAIVQQYDYNNSVQQSLTQAVTTVPAVTEPSEKEQASDSNVKPTKNVTESSK